MNPLTKKPKNSFSVSQSRSLGTGILDSLKARSGFFSFSVSPKARGFTLIELLICLVVIGILATLALTNYRASQRQARDTQRRSDLAQYRNALENYATVNDSLYPVITPRELISASLCSGAGGTLDGSGFMTACPQDPHSAETICGAGSALPCDYYYVSSADGWAYVLSSALEATDDCWVVCSTGQVGRITDCPADSTCPL